MNNTPRGPSDKDPKNIVLFTPGPVKTPHLVARYLAEPPCNYHRQDAFCEMFARNESDLKKLIGIEQPDRYFATILTSTGTGANEGVLLALARLGRGLIICNGYFGARAVAQAVQTGIDHTVLEAAYDRPLDPDDVARAIDGNPGLRWAFFVSHETRVGLANPFESIARLCKERGLVVGVDIVSSSYAYPLDLEASGIDLATSSSAKAIMAAPGLGIVFVRREVIPTLQSGPNPCTSYYLDLVAEFEKQSSEFQTRFAQPVVLHAALRGACEHLSTVGVTNHMARIQRQMDRLIEHLRTLDVQPLLDPEYRSGIAVNFGLPSSMSYASFSRELAKRGYFVLYGIPGDDTHFQLSTIGDLSDAEVAGLEQALSDVLSAR